MSPRGLGMLLLWGLCLLASPGWASSLDWLSQGRSLLDGGLGSAASAPASPVLGKRPVFLPVEQAFVVQGRQEGESLLLSVTVTPGHYVYQQRFALTPSAGVRLGPLQYSRAPVFVDDPDFGRVPVFDQSVEVRATVQGQGEVGYRWQGCAKAGLCYPPQQGTLRVEAVSRAAGTRPVPADYAAIQVPREALTVPSLLTTLRKPGADVHIIPLPSAQATVDPGAVAREAGSVSAGEVFDWPYPPVMPREPRVWWPWATGASAPAAMATDPAVPQPDGVVDLDPFGLGRHPLTALLLLFLAGLGLAFTPCVLPMLPIVANLVARQHRRSPWHGFALAASYGVGVASSYALLGALVALFGHQLNLIGWLQQPAVLLGFAAVFVLLAAASFDLVQLRLPSRLRDWVSRVGQHGQHARWGGSVLGSAVAGFLSALVVSPCVSAPLAGVLLSVSTVGNPLLGAAALFMLGLGLSLPLMLLGATEGRLLPKAGLWLDWVRQGFGLLLLAVALVLVGRIWQQPWLLGLWSALFFLLASWMASWAGRARWVSRAAAAMLGSWGLIVLAGLALGNSDPWHPLESSRTLLAPVAATPASPDLQAIRAAPVIHRLEELEALRQQHPRLLVDVTADWCISCKVMERELFGADILPALQGWQRVRLDVTDSNADSQRVLQQLGLFGPPALLFYQDGQRVQQLTGETSREQLAATLAAL